MRTLVFQSYRTVDVPAAIERSMRSVRNWASARGHEYAFHDDTFFDAVPAWYRERVPTNKETGPRDGQASNTSVMLTARISVRAMPPEGACPADSSLSGERRHCLHIRHHRSRRGAS